MSGQVFGGLLTAPNQAKKELVDIPIHCYRDSDHLYRVG